MYPVENEHDHKHWYSVKYEDEQLVRGYVAFETLYKLDDPDNRTGEDENAGGVNDIHVSLIRKLLVEESRRRCFMQSVVEQESCDDETGKEADLDKKTHGSNNAADVPHVSIACSHQAGAAELGEKCNDVACYEGPGKPLPTDEEKRIASNCCADTAQLHIYGCGKKSRSN